MSMTAIPTDHVHVESPFVVEDCPACDLTDAVACPACNGMGVIVARVVHPS